AFAPFVIIDQRCDPIAALRESRRLTAGRKSQVLKLGLLLLATNILGAIAFGVGLLITIPTTTIAAAHVYRWLQAHVSHDAGASRSSAAPLTVALKGE